MYPELSDLRALERETLFKIAQVPGFGRIRTGDAGTVSLQQSAQRQYQAIQPAHGGVNIHFGFTLDIRLRADAGERSKPRRVDIGAIVVPTSDGKRISRTSYSLIICDRPTLPRASVIRKLHFDFESTEVSGSKERKPSIHMQVCGELGAPHRRAGYDDKHLRHLFPAFEKPRIPVPPISLAMMLNWLLLEFQTDPAAQPILSNPSWRSQVHKAEECVLKRYFAVGSDFLTSAAKAPTGFYNSCLYKA